MTDTVKKPMSKKKKIAIIVLSIIAGLIVLVVIAGAIALNWYCKPGEYEIVNSDKNITLVAHRGFRGVAPENTEPAFFKAGQAGFWGAECDTYRTADGVWVIEHDPVTYRMHGGVKNIEKLTYDELYNMPITNGIDIENYADLRICTLDTYLNICKDFGMTPVIELKGKNNTEYYGEIIDLVAKYDLEAIYISFEFESIKALREVTNAKLFYLVNEITDEDIALAKSIDNCGIDFDGNKEKNFENGMIAKCQEEGLELGAWTIDELEVVDKLVENGVTLITTNAIEPAK